ncbi:MAG TPA: hypothetical protein VIH05_08085 [Tepidiformaceae bacterium]
MPPGGAVAGQNEIRRMIPPTPAQARLLRAVSQHPDHYLRVWFGSVDFVERAKIDVPEGRWWPGGDKSGASKETAMVCVRLGWLQRTPSVLGSWRMGGEASLYLITDLGQQAIDGLPDDAYRSIPRIVPSVDGHAAEVLRALLARHDPAKGWVFLIEAPMDIGGGHHAVDAWAINCFASQNHRRVGYEVKVSRSDFVGELKKPDKTARSARFCTSFYFACPVGVLKPADVPDPYGLVHVFEKGTTRVVKKSTLPPSDPTWGLVGRLLRRLAQMEEESA